MELIKLLNGVKENHLAFSLKLRKREREERRTTKAEKIPNLRKVSSLNPWEVSKEF